MPPPKRVPQTDAIFEQLKAVNPVADRAKDTLRISIDAKATVNVGPFSRRGRSRTGTKAADHDFKTEATPTPFGIFLPEHDDLWLYMARSKITSDFISPLPVGLERLPAAEREAPDHRRPPLLERGGPGEAGPVAVALEKPGDPEPLRMIAPESGMDTVDLLEPIDDLNGRDRVLAVPIADEGARERSEDEADPGRSDPATTLAFCRRSRAVQHGPHLPSSAHARISSNARAPAREEAGFWPVTSLPSVTAKLAQSAAFS